MVAAREKVILAHWYYSVSEWERFIRSVHKKTWASVLIQSVMVGVTALLALRFYAKASWLANAVTSGLITICFGIGKYAFQLWKLKWKGESIPEIEITDYMVVINDKLIVFQGQGKLLRKVDIKDRNNINILEISYEWQSGGQVSFEELLIPVPKGRLREAMEVQQCLNLRKDLLSLFS